MKSTPLDISWDNLFSSIIKFESVNLKAEIDHSNLSSNDLISISCVEYLLLGQSTLILHSHLIINLQRNLLIITL